MNIPDELISTISDDKQEKFDRNGDNSHLPEEQDRLPPPPQVSFYSSGSSSRIHTSISTRQTSLTSSQVLPITIWSPAATKNDNNSNSNYHSNDNNQQQPINNTDYTTDTNKQQNKEAVLDSNYNTNNDAYDEKSLQPDYYNQQYQDHLQTQYPAEMSYEQQEQQQYHEYSGESSSYDYNSYPYYDQSLQTTEPQSAVESTTNYQEDPGVYATETAQNVAQYEEYDAAYSSNYYYQQPSDHSYYEQQGSESSYYQTTENQDYSTNTWQQDTTTYDSSSQYYDQTTYVSYDQTVDTYYSPEQQQQYDPQGFYHSVEHHTETEGLYTSGEHSAYAVPLPQSSATAYEYSSYPNQTTTYDSSSEIYSQPPSSIPLPENHHYYAQQQDYNPYLQQQFQESPQDQHYNSESYVSQDQLVEQLPDDQTQEQNNVDENTDNNSEVQQKQRHLQVWEKFFQNAFAMREAAGDGDEAAEDFNYSSNDLYTQTYNRVTKQSSSSSAPASSSAIMQNIMRPVDFKSEKARYYFVLTSSSPAPSSNTSYVPPEHISASFPWPSLISNRKYLSLVSFVENNANVAIRDISLLFFALVASILQRDPYHVESLLLLAGAHVRSVRDTFGRHLLHYAAYIGDIDIMALLVDGMVMEMDINDLDHLLSAQHSGTQSSSSRRKSKQPLPYLETPLHVAVKHNHADMIEFLLQSAMEIDRKDSYGLTPRDWAISLGHEQCLTVISDATSPTDNNMHSTESSFIRDDSQLLSPSPPPTYQPQLIQQSHQLAATSSSAKHHAPTMTLPTNEETNSNPSTSYHNPNDILQQQQQHQKQSSQHRKSLPETKTMSMTRMIDDFLLSASETTPSTPVTPAVPPALPPKTSSQPTITSITETSAHQPNSSSSYQRPKEVDDLIKGFQAKDKARRAASASNAATSSPANTTLQSQSSTTTVQSQQQANHHRNRSSSNSTNGLSPSQRHYYDISSDSNDDANNSKEHHNSHHNHNHHISHHKSPSSTSSMSSPNHTNSANGIPRSPRIPSQHASPSGNSSGLKSRRNSHQSRDNAASLASTSATTNQQSSSGIHASTNHSSHFSMPVNNSRPKYSHHSDADDEYEQQQQHNVQKQQTRSPMADDIEEEVVIKEEIIPSFAERLATRLWSMLWYLFSLSMSLLFFSSFFSKTKVQQSSAESSDGDEDDYDTVHNRPNEGYNSSDGRHKVKNQNEEEDLDSLYLYNNSGHSNLQHHSKASSAKKQSYSSTTSNIFGGMFQSLFGSRLGTRTQKSAHSSDNTSTANHHHIDAISRQSSAGSTSSMVSDTPSSPPVSGYYNSQGRATMENNNSNYGNSSSNTAYSAHLTPRKPPPEVQLAIALSRQQQQQQQQQNSFSLGDRLPQGVSWRYVNVLPAETSGGGSSPPSSTTLPVGGPETTAANAVRQRKPKPYDD